LRPAAEARNAVKSRKPGPKHEALCRRCGRCCYETYVVEDAVFRSHTPCAYLDVETNSCTVYERRLEINSRCMDVETGIRFGVFPADCPYVQGREGYVPPEPGWLDDETARLIEDGRFQTADEVRAFIREKGRQWNREEREEREERRKRKEMR
jgi:hypothetical protein